MSRSENVNTSTHVNTAKYSLWVKWEFYPDRDHLNIGFNFWSHPKDRPNHLIHMYYMYKCKKIWWLVLCDVLLINQTFIPYGSRFHANKRPSNLIGSWRLWIYCKSIKSKCFWTGPYGVFQTRIVKSQ